MPRFVVIILSILFVSVAVFAALFFCRTWNVPDDFAAPTSGAALSDPSEQVVQEDQAAQTEQEDQKTSQAAASAQYVGNAVCIGCHEKLGERWKISYHAKAMALANDETVLGRFDNVRVKHFNSAAHFFRKGGQFWVRPDILVEDSNPEKSGAASSGVASSGVAQSKLDNTDNSAPEYQVKYVLGFYPLQQYLVEFPNGAMQCLPYAWDVDGNRWYHLYADEPIPEGDPLHWKQPVQNWNAVCADCHTTNLKRNYRLSDDTWHTTCSEFNVGCEACHGPGSVHAEIAKKAEGKVDQTGAAAVSNTIAKNEASSSSSKAFPGTYPETNPGTYSETYPETNPETYSGLFSFAKADGPTATDACSVCHARRREIYPGFIPGQKFCDYWFPELLDSDAFYPDGQIREEDYEYTSFLQSKFYAQGGSCGDCHDRFIAKVSHLNSAEGTAPTVTAICGRCHELSKYDTAAHHFHDAGKNMAGTRCEDCHMPSATYMGVDVRRDHSICIPRPQLTIDLNIPNACNRCHTDKTAEWALQLCEKWYGRRDCRNHFAYALAGGRKEDPAALDGLIRVLEDAALPPIVRASAGRLLNTYSGPTVKSALIGQLSNPSELVRTTCVEALEGKFDYPPEQRRVLVPLLKDPVRSVRLQAFRVLAGVWNSRLPDIDAPTQKLYQSVRQEYLTSLNNQPEHAAAHLNRGVLSEQENEPLQAVAHYRNALRRDSRFLPALNNLGLLQYSLGDLSGAEELYRRITELYPDQFDGWRFLGMVEAEIAQNPDTPRPANKLAAAAESFQKAICLAPDNSRLYYNLGLIQFQLNRIPEARAALKKAIQLDPDNPQYRAALDSVPASSANQGGPLKTGDPQ